MYMTFNEYLTEKVNKPKEMSGYDYYKSIRKPTAKPGSAFKDKSKYSRKEKHKNDVYNESTESDFYKQISGMLETFGLKAFEQDPILKIVQKAISTAYSEGYKAGSTGPFKSLK